MLIGRRSTGFYYIKLFVLEKQIARLVYSDYEWYGRTDAVLSKNLSIDKFDFGPSRVFSTVRSTISIILTSVPHFNTVDKVRETFKSFHYQFEHFFGNVVILFISSNYLCETTIKNKIIYMSMVNRTMVFKVHRLFI